MKETTVDQLLERYDGFLLDAYGVLVNSRQTLPGANEFLAELTRRGKPFRVVSNDGSTTPEAKVERWSKRGLEVPAHCLVTPWSVLASDLSPVHVEGRKGFVIGTPLSQEMFRRAGGLAVTGEELPELLILADELTEPFMARCDLALTLVVRAHQGGRQVDLVLANPDMVYPTDVGYGFTAGAICRMFEAGLERLLGTPCPFLHVGKPGPEMLQLAAQQMGLARDRVVMLGDQWATDVEGARRAGIDSVLVTTGLDQPDLTRPEQLILRSLSA